LGVTRQPADDATDGEQGYSAENQPSRDTAARIEDLKAIETIVRSIGSADLDDVYAPVTFGRRHKKSMNSGSRPGNRGSRSDPDFVPLRAQPDV
jgi:hypothetical protein